MKRIMFLSIGTACALIFCTHALEIEGFTPDQTVAYKTVDGVELQLHIFNPPGHKPTDKRPAIVFFFGGGWNSGSPSQFYPHCQYLADRGMVAMSADYRVKKRNGTTPVECVKDGKSAIRWIRQHAGELGIDPRHLAAGGGSAGGHVAAAIAATTEFNDERDDQSISCMPNALVLFNPVYDNGPEGYGHGRVKDYWQAISPLHNIHSNMPPTVVFLGTNDKHVPVKTAEEYRKRMQDLGLRCDLHIYEGKEHGFFNYTQTEDYAETVAEMDRFLVSLNFLKAAP